MKQRIETFLEVLAEEKGVSANTLSAYRNDLTQFAAYLEGGGANQDGLAVPITTVDRECLVGFLNHLRERGYAPASLARKVAALKSFFHHLRRLGEIAADPTDGIGSPEVKKVLPRSISAEDVRTLFQHAHTRAGPDALRDIAMLRMLYATGMRVSELVTLDLSHVRLKEGQVVVAGRGGRTRTLPVDAVTARELRTYLEGSRPYLTRHDPSQPALFLNHRGQRLTRQGFWLIMKALVKDAGLPVLVTPHTLRHSFASHRLGDGVALQQLQQLLGHASISTTQIYAQRPENPETAPPSTRPVAPTRQPPPRPPRRRLVPAR